MLSESLCISLKDFIEKNKMRLKKKKQTLSQKMKDIPIKYNRLYTLVTKMYRLPRTLKWTLDKRMWTWASTWEAAQ